MKTHNPSAKMQTPAIFASALLALAAIAQAVPTEINFQGVLTDQNGNPVNGVRAMQIKIYDAPTGGTLLYSEDLGNVPVQDGIYSFSFGANGTSNALTTETVAIANGTVSTFQKVLSAAEVVAGSVTVTEGNYTWNQTNGSSNENDFGVSYNSSLRRVTVNYYNGPPSSGKTIFASYRTAVAGVSDAIRGSNQLWLETTINGTPQTPKQKILAVPFAISSSRSQVADTISGVLKSRILRVDRFFTIQGWNSGATQIRSLPFQYTPSGTSTFSTSFGGPFDGLPQLVSTPIFLPIPCKIVGLKASVVDTAVQTTSTGSYSFGNIKISLWHKAADGSDEVLHTIDSGSAFSGGISELSASLNKFYDGNNVFWITIDAPIVNKSGEGATSLTVSGQLKVNWVSILFEQIEGS